MWPKRRPKPTPLAPAPRATKRSSAPISVDLGRPTRPDGPCAAGALATRLPGARGPITEALFGGLTGQAPFRCRCPAGAGDPLTDDDLQLALYCCYELHYRGFADVSSRCEWDPSVLAFRSALEEAFTRRLWEESSYPEVADEDVAAELWRMSGDDTGASLSGWLSEHGTIGHARELAVHRSAYQLKEADPHTWAIPRLAGRAKAAMVTIQADEYGNGDSLAMHASLFARTMDSLGLESGYGAYLEWLPGVTLATTNVISLFGLHRRWRGALVGHLALFEMTSVGPMGRYSRWLDRLGVPQAGRRFYDEHVSADAVHQLVASSDLVGGLLDAEPSLAQDVLFGARALGGVEARLSERLRSAWVAGTPALLAGCPAIG